jgi:putative tricarboxylic transport membrane protein
VVFFPEGKEIMKKPGQWSSLVWLSFAILILVESLRMPLGSWRDPGAGFLPLWSGILLAFLSLIDYGQSRREEDRPGEKPEESGRGTKNLLWVVAALFGDSIFLEILGFLLTTFLLLLILFRAGGPQRWTMALGGSVTASLLSYVLFEVWLKTQLPKGIFGF